MTDTKDVRGLNTVLPVKLIGQMFDRIAYVYDIINHILSLGCDIRWRNRLADLAGKDSNLRILDLATGTGDLLIALLRNNPKITKAVGLDISENMLKLCREKTAKCGLSDRISLVLADVADENFPDGNFDLVTMGFGIRNTPDVLNSLIKINRLLKKGKAALILEFSIPKGRIIGSCYRFYLRNFVPLLGGLLSGQVDPYRYLSKSIRNFYSADDFCNLMQKAGFRDVIAMPLTFGIACIYRGYAA